MVDVKLYHGDALAILKTLDAGSVDSIVCDPPYGLSFMGKDWDHGVPGVAFWEAALRVAKPGAYLLAFGGTRTFHRLTVAIEDAGWQIRDCLAWIYGQGFPKSHNYSWAMHEQACSLCGIMVEYDYEQTTINSRGIEGAATRAARGKSEAEHGMRFVRATYLQTPVYACAQCGQVLQPFMPKQNSQEHRRAWAESQIVWPEQSSVEGWSNLEATEGELQRCSVCTLSSGVYADGAQGWLHNGASACDGSISWQVANEDGSRPSYRPQSSEQLHRQPDAIRLERAAQKARGFGTALKPSFEPIIMARKPLIGTVAENVLAHGCGGLNVDACRMPVDENDPNHRPGVDHAAYDSRSIFGVGGEKRGRLPQGRWPANLMLDEEAARLLDGQSGTLTSGKPTNGSKPTTANAYGKYAQRSLNGGGDTGGASRFFYVAKASRRDRDEGLEGMEEKHIRRHSGGEFAHNSGSTNSSKNGAHLRNHHPTVKPTQLMRYLCRMVTPPSGTVLDPFCGSGSTGKAAVMEGFRFVGVEIDAEYLEIARRRIEEAQMQLPLLEVA